MKKRVLSMILALLLLFSLSVTALADEGFDVEQQIISDVLEETVNESNQNETALSDENEIISDDDDLIALEPASTDETIPEKDDEDLVLDKENYNSDIDAFNNKIEGEGFLAEASAFATGKSSSVALSDNLTLTDIKYQIIAGEMNYNPGSLGRLCITGTVTGSSSVVDVWIATWQDTQPSAGTAKEAAEHMVSIWQEKGNTPYVQTLPFELYNVRPIFARATPHNSP